MSEDLAVWNASGDTLDLMVANPQPGHMLGPVKDDWAAIEVFLRILAEKVEAGERSQETISTYQYHLTKLKWFCENVERVTPSRWTMDNALHFFEFLRNLPVDALCRRRQVDGKVIENSFVAENEPGWTPFRKQPSDSAIGDIKRCAHALFTAWHKAGYIRIHPLALIGAGKARKVKTERSISLDVYALILDTIAKQPTETYLERKMQLRDLFVFEALRGLGLRASELVGARMSAFYQVTDVKSRMRYWVFHVTEETAKGRKARKVPVPPQVWQSFVDYRQAFGLSPVPLTGDETALLLSPRTKDVKIGEKAIKRTPDRRFFGAWGAVESRKGLYKIVKGRLYHAASWLREHGEHSVADRLEAASPHWLRHTFGKSKVEEGIQMRALSGAMGHASVDTTMIYTEQEALDLIASYEAANPGSVASERICEA